MKKIDISEGYVLEILRSDLRVKIWSYLANIKEDNLGTILELYFNSDGVKVESNSFEYGDEYTIIRIERKNYISRWYITMAHTLTYKHKKTSINV